MGSHEYPMKSPCFPPPPGLQPLQWTLAACTKHTRLDYKQRQSRALALLLDYSGFGGSSNPGLTTIRSAAQQRTSHQQVGSPIRCIAPIPSVPWYAVVLGASWSTATANHPESDLQGVTFRTLSFRARNALGVR